MTILDVVSLLLQLGILVVVIVLSRQSAQAVRDAHSARVDAHLAAARADDAARAAEGRRLPGDPGPDGVRGPDGVQP